MRVLFNFYGETIEDARKMAKEAIELYIETLQDYDHDESLKNLMRLW